MNHQLQGSKASTRKNSAGEARQFWKQALGVVDHSFVDIAVLSEFIALILSAQVIWTPLILPSRQMFLRSLRQPLQVSRHTRGM